MEEPANLHQALEIAMNIEKVARFGMIRRFKPKVMRCHKESYANEQRRLEVVNVVSSGYQPVAPVKSLDSVPPYDASYVSHEMKVEPRNCIVYPNEVNMFLPKQMPHMFVQDDAYQEPLKVCVPELTPLHIVDQTPSQVSCQQNALDLACMVENIEVKHGLDSHIISSEVNNDFVYMEYNQDCLSHEANMDGDCSTSNFENDNADSDCSLLEDDIEDSIENDFSEVSNPLFDEEVYLDQVVLCHNTFECAFNEFANPLYEEIIESFDDSDAAPICRMDGYADQDVISNLMPFYHTESSCSANNDDVVEHG